MSFGETHGIVPPQYALLFFDGVPPPVIVTRAPRRISRQPSGKPTIPAAESTDSDIRPSESCSLATIAASGEQHLHLFQQRGDLALFVEGGGDQFFGDSWLTSAGRFG